MGYNIDGAISDLMPRGLFGRYDNDREGFDREYRKLLDSAGVDKILRQLQSYERHGKDIVLLCYEDIRKGDNDWCHRVMFANWWLENTGEVIAELADPTTPKINKSKKSETPKTAKKGNVIKWLR